VVAATTAAVSSRFNGFSTVGGIIGTAVSASVLILLGLMNAYILFKLVQQMRKVLPFYRRRRLLSQQGEEGVDGDDGALVHNESENDIWKIEGGGFLFSMLRKLFVLIDRYFFLPC
jgi:nickel/cobalt transporter (NiCoT) family protein